MSSLVMPPRMGVNFTSSTFTADHSSTHVLQRLMTSFRNSLGLPEMRARRNAVSMSKDEIFQNLEVSTLARLAKAS